MTAAVQSGLPDAFKVPYTRGQSLRFEMGGKLHALDFVRFHDAVALKEYGYSPVGELMAMIDRVRTREKLRERLPEDRELLMEHGATMADLLRMPVEMVCGLADKLRAELAKPVMKTASLGPSETMAHRLLAGLRS